MGLEAIRRKAGITQAELQKLSGVKQATISKIERGETKEPSLTTLKSLTAAFAESGIDACFEDFITN